MVFDLQLSDKKTFNLSVISGVPQGQLLRALLLLNCDSLSETENTEDVYSIPADAVTEFLKAHKGNKSLHLTILTQPLSNGNISCNFLLFTL